MAKKAPLVLYSGLPGQLLGTDYFVPYDRFIRVDKSGDDTNAASSSWDKPKLTLASAISLATIAGGDWTIYMGRGTFIENSGVQLGNGSGGWQLVGAGRGQTIIQSSLDLTVSNKAILAPGNNSYIRGITVHGTAAAVVPFGIGTSNANATGTIIVEDCEFYSDSGGSDCFYINTPSGTGGNYRIYRTKGLSGGDTVISFAAASMEFHDCELISDGSSGSTSNGVKNSSGAPIYIFGGTVSGDANSFFSAGASSPIFGFGVKFIPGTASNYVDLNGIGCKTSGCARSDGASFVINAAVDVAVDFLGENTKPSTNRIIQSDHSLVVASQYILPSGVSLLIKNDGVLMIL